MKCFPDTPEEYALLSDAVGRGAIGLTPAGRRHVQRKWGQVRAVKYVEASGSKDDWLDYASMPDKDESTRV